MGEFFAPNPGEIEIIPWYADNEICLQEVRFSICADKWPEFQNSDLFRKLSASYPQVNGILENQKQKTDQGGEEMTNSFRFPTSWDDVPVVVDLAYVANIFQMTYEYIKRLARNGEIPAFKMGDSWYIQKQDLLSYIEQRKVKS